MFRILVIDDDPTTRLLLSRKLNQQGYGVEVATNGAEGLAQAAKFLPHLVICDWMMPMIDGLEVCRRLKADPRFATTFFVLLTAKDDIADRIQGLDAGADEFLSKPLEMDELRARVQAGLRLHQLSQDLQQQKQKLEAELAEAANYLRSLLPPPLSYPLPIDARFLPSRELGGDCFDYFWLDENHLIMYVLDVAGHGLGAALPSVSVLNLLRSRSTIGTTYYQPETILKILNQTFPMSNDSQKYFTLWYGVYSRSTAQLTYASAGHPPAILLSGGGDTPVKYQKLKTPGLPIGLFPHSNFQSGVCTVEPGSTLFVFTDGIYEITLADGEVWDVDGFVQLLVNDRQQHSQNLDAIIAQIQAINATGSFEDDCSLLKIEFAP